jgi:hypothetical protein
MKEEVFMKRCLILLCVLLFASTIALAAGLNTYQVTGPVLEVKDDVIVVQKGKEKWEIARDKDTKVTGDLQVGAKVTIQYTMKAASIDVKSDAKKGGAKKK